MQLIQIDIIACTGNEFKCKSKEEIYSYFAEKYFAILSNQIRFDFEKYGPESISKESKIDIEYLGDWQNRVIYEINQTELDL